ncbi:MAG: adenylosuccinate synthetase [Parcubacteria group bacterium]|nr:adenylosuccinate synthetase [Parcubacteria group bacterium]
MKKIYIVTDLGPGDGGKGGAVHRIATAMGAALILKIGGAQGSHGVRTSSGNEFAFSQWGCGTFEGIPTLMSPRFIAHPEGLLNEAKALREAGVADPFALMRAHEACLCATPLHGIASHIKELARGNNPRGTIGTGVGESVRYDQSHPELSIRAGDLNGLDLRDRLAAVRDQIRTDLQRLREFPFLPEDRPLAQKEFDLIDDDRFLDFVIRRFQIVGHSLDITSADQFSDILRRDQILVGESSHGILTDAFTGFHPHTSAIRTLPRFAQGMLQEAGYNGQIVNIAVHRAYTIRHGAGPMPTADPAMGEHLLPGSHKDENRWQGSIRVGPLDLPLLRYAIAASGGPSAYDGLCLTWFDQVASNGTWNICHRYQSGTQDPTYFTQEGELRQRTGNDEEQMRYTEALGEKVNACTPDITSVDVPSGATSDQLFRLVKAVLDDCLKVPVRMLSLGPTEADKVLN